MRTWAGETGRKFSVGRQDGSGTLVQRFSPIFVVPQPIFEANPNPRKPLCPSPPALSPPPPPALPLPPRPTTWSRNRGSQGKSPLSSPALLTLAAPPLPPPLLQLRRLHLLRIQVPKNRQILPSFQLRSAPPPRFPCFACDFRSLTTRWSVGFFKNREVDRHGVEGQEEEPEARALAALRWSQHRGGEGFSSACFLSNQIEASKETTHTLGFGCCR